MDLSKQHNAVIKKTMKTEVEKMTEKLSKQTSRLIKIKVGQDTAYWELKEKQSLTKRDHETLQRNIMQLQMDHEAVSAHYQDELRHRPETLNKLVSTREICDVLELNVSRVRAALQRSADDRAALTAAYERASAAVTAQHAENKKRLLAANNEARAAQGLVRLSSEHGVQLMECVSRETARANQAAADAERLREQKHSIAEQLARADTLLQERQKTIQELQNDLRRMGTEFNEHNERAKNAIVELERKAGAGAALRVALSQAEARGDAAARDAARLETELAAAAAGREDAAQRAATLTLQIQEAYTQNDKMKESMEFLVQTGDDLAKQLEDKNKKICSLEKVVAESQKELVERAAIADKERERERYEYKERETKYERELHDCKESIATAQRELKERADTIEKLMLNIAEMNETMSRAETTIIEQATQIERERSDNANRAEAAERELAEYSNTIERLKREIAAEVEARAHADVSIAKITAERERERRDHEEHVANTTRELTKLDDTIARLKHDLALETEARVHADAALADHAVKLERERRDFEERVASAERELAERNVTIAHLRRDLAVESEARASADNSLNFTRTELDTTRQEAARFREDIRHLKADAWRKDDEAKKQMQVILSIRDEKEKMQQKISDLQNTISNIQEITNKSPTPAAAALRCDAPEHDDNAVPAPEPPCRAFDQPPISSQAKTSAPHPKKPKTVQNSKHADSVFNLFSDTDSMDGGDAGEVSRRFEPLSRRVLSPVPLSLKRRNGAARVRVPTPAPISSSVPEPPRHPAPPRAATSARKFFKSRRDIHDKLPKK